MAFDPIKEGATEVFDPAKEGAVALEERQQPLDPNEAFERAGKVWDMSVDSQVPLRDVDEHYPTIATVAKKKQSIDLSSIEAIALPLEELVPGYKPKKPYPLYFGRLLKEISAGTLRFLERGVGGTFGGTLYDWLGQFIMHGGAAVDELSKLGVKNTDQIYNPYAEAIMAAGKQISQRGKEAREWWAYHATTGWEAFDEDLKKTDPISYGAGRLSEGIASSALAVLSMYLSGGGTAYPELVARAPQINSGLVALSTISAAGGFEHAQNQGENFLWSTLHGLADGAIEYAMESRFLEGVGMGTGKLAAGTKEGLEEFVTGMFQNTRAGILENVNKGMTTYQAAKNAIVASLTQSPWEVAAGFIGGFGIAGGADLATLAKTSLAKPPAEEAIVKPEKPAVAISKPKPPAKPAAKESKVVYHASHEAIKKFEVGKAKPHQIAGIYFSKEGATEWGGGKRPFLYKVDVSDAKLAPYDEARQVYTTEMGKGKGYEQRAADILENRGYDGVDLGKNEIVVFSPEKVAILETLRQPLAKPVEKEMWGEKNTGVTLEEYEAIKEKQKKGRLKGSREAGGTILFDPKEWSDAIKVGRFHLEAGAKAFADWAQRMVTDFGEGIREHLPRMWTEIQPLPEPKIAEETEKAVGKPTRDILGGIDPLQEIHKALKEAKGVQPLTKAQKAEALRKRVGAAVGALKSNVKKGVPTEEAIFKSTGLLKGPLTEYDQLYTSVEDVLEPGAKEAAYAKIYSHPDLQYFEILNTATSFKKLLAGTALTPTDVRNIENVFGKAFQDVTETRLVKSDLYDRIITLWKAGLLTGIKTSGLNTLANLSHAVSETAKDVPASLVDRTAALFTGDRTLAFTAKGTAAGIKEGIKRGWKYLRTGYDERNIGAKLDYKTVHFGNGKIAKGFQAYEETIFHLLGAEDQPFYYGAKAKSLFSQAIAQAKNKGLKGKERDAFVKNLVENPTNDMLTASVHDAEVAVFQNRTNLGDLAKAIQKVKGGEAIVPFGRTPSAVAMQIVNYSPIGAVNEVARQISAGKFNQRKFSQAFGRAAVGTGALFIGTMLLRKGLITLDHPDTERERELWKLEGRKANSIKIGDKWRTIQVLGPVGNLLLIGAHFQYQLQKEGSPTKAVVKAMAGGAKSFTEQTFMRGVNLAVDALVSPERSFENWFSSMAGSAVPTIIGDMARAQDEQGRRAVGPKERVQARIPIARKGLEPSIDVFGQDLPRYGGNVLETMADPSRPAKIRHDVVVDELRRLFDKDIKVSPTKLGDKEGYDILTPEENTQLWRRAGELTYKALLALVDSEEYQKLDDDFVKGKFIESITTKTKEAAKMELVMIKLKQGLTITELGESGLLTVEGMETLKYYGESRSGKE